MTADCYTFSDIVRFNSDDWAQAYGLTGFLKRGTLTKERRGPENFICQKSGRIGPINLIHRRKFFSQAEHFRNRLTIKKAYPRAVPEKPQGDV